MVIDVAIHVPGARIRRARILAAIVDASFIRRTIRITLATKKNARDSRIAPVSWWTFTDRFMINAIAHGAVSAGGQQRRTHWNTVVLNTRVRSAAITVCAASGDFSASQIRITVVSQNARADRLMICDTAFRIGTAGARILAHRVNTRLLRGTIAVPGTFYLHDRFRRSTSTAATAHVSTRTDANHRAYWIRWKNLAFRWFAARLHNGARILTLVIEAGQQIRTITVLCTLWPLFWFASNVRISSVMSWTTANWQMIEDSAFSS